MRPTDCGSTDIVEEVLWRDLARSARYFGGRSWVFNVAELSECKMIPSRDRKNKTRSSLGEDCFSLSLVAIREKL